MGLGKRRRDLTWSDGPRCPKRGFLRFLSILSSGGGARPQSFFSGTTERRWGLRTAPGGVEGGGGGLARMGGRIEGKGDRVMGGHRGFMRGFAAFGRGRPGWECGVGGGEGGGVGGGGRGGGGWGWGGGGGGWGVGRRARRGDVKFFILEILAEGPRHGYDVIAALEQRSGGRYRPSPGSVYPTLQ